MTSEDLLALNVLEEAGGEIPDGQAAIARVTLNRMRLKFESDGTIFGTVLAKDQFSWAWFGFGVPHTGAGVHENSKEQYMRLSYTASEALALAEDLKEMARQADLSACGAIAGLVEVGAYQGTLYDQLTDDTVLYLNPRILTKLPDWAIPEAKVCAIGHHDFYRSVPLTA